MESAVGMLRGVSSCLPMLDAQHLHVTQDNAHPISPTRARACARARGKWEEGKGEGGICGSAAYSLLWNALRRVSQVCWPAATAARAGRSVLYSMVADVPRDDDDVTNRRRKENAVGARSIEKAFKFGFPFGRLAPQFRRRFKTSYAIRRLRRLRFKSSTQVLSSQVRNRNQQGIPPPLAPTHPDLLKRTCAREQPPNPTCPHRLLFHHTHVTRTWAIASLPLRHRSAGAGACTRTPGRRGRQPWR